MTLEELPSFVCFGHRGAAGHAPENTCASMQKALELGVHAVEFDVHWVDEHLVVTHNARWGKGPQAKLLQDYSFEALRQLDAGNGEQIPTLEEVLKVLQKKVVVNIELKGPGTALPVADVIQEFVTEYGWEMSQFLVSSFDHHQLLQLQQVLPEVAKAIIFSGNPLDPMALLRELDLFSVHLDAEFLDQQLIDTIHELGVKTYVFTVNHQEDVRRLKHLGVDGVFSDYPEVVLS